MTAGKGKPGSVNSFLVRLSYRLAACLLPYFFLAACVSLVSDFMGMMIARPSPSFWLLLAAGALAGTAASAILRSEKATDPARLRALVASILLIYAFTVIARDMPFPRRLVPSAQEVILMICLVIQWIWSGRFEEFFTDRELFIRRMRGLDGRNLYEEMRNEDILSAAADEGLRHIRAFSQTLAFILFFVLTLGSLVSLSGSTSAGVSAVSAVFSVLFFCLHLLVMTVIRTAVDEQFYAGLGLGTVFSLGGRRLFLSAAIIGAAFALAALLASGGPIIPPAFLLWLFALLGSLFTRTYSVPEGIELYLPEQSDNSGPMPDFSELALEPVWDPAPLFRVLKYIALAAAIALALFFMLAPLFGKKWRTFWTENRLGKYLMSFFRMLRDAFRDLFRRDVGTQRPVIAGTSRKNLASTLESQARPGKSLQKKREIGRLTAGFFRILDWGEASGTVCTPDQPPGEYTEKLAGRHPDRSAPLRAAAELFEKALYSPALLSPDEETRFFAAVEQAVSQPVAPAGASAGLQAVSPTDSQEE